MLEADANRLNLSPILNLSPDLRQVVDVPTRLNPEGTLDPIITSLASYYKAPVTKPPIQSDINSRGVDSDHLVVLFEPVRSSQDIEPRKYKVIERRPLSKSGMKLFSEWVEQCNWSSLYKCEDLNLKTEIFQKMLMDKYLECFPLKKC